MSKVLRWCFSRTNKDMVVLLSLSFLWASFLSNIGFTPVYNTPLAFFSFSVWGIENKICANYYPVLLVITLVLDITWCSIFGPGAAYGIQSFVLVMTCVVLFIKVPLIYYSYMYMTELGGELPLLAACSQTEGWTPKLGSTYDGIPEDEDVVNLNPELDQNPNIKIIPTPKPSQTLSTVRGYQAGDGDV